MKGCGVAKDPALAFRWFLRAAVSGYAVAQFNVGMCFAHGQGVEKDAVQAASWFRRAADGGDVAAQAYVSDLLCGRTSSSEDPQTLE